MLIYFSLCIILNDSVVMIEGFKYCPYVCNENTFFFNKSRISAQIMYSLNGNSAMVVN